MVEEGQNLVGWVVAAGAGAGRDDAVEGGLFEGDIGVQVDHRGVDLFVSEPERDDGGVDAGVQQCHRRGVPQRMWTDLLPGQ